jgi:hypothetical protein
MTPQGVVVSVGCGMMGGMTCQAILRPQQPKRASSPRWAYRQPPAGVTGPVCGGRLIAKFEYDWDTASFTVTCTRCDLDHYSSPQLRGMDLEKLAETLLQAHLDTLP